MFPYDTHDTFDESFPLAPDATAWCMYETMRQRRAGAETYLKNLYTLFDKYGCKFKSTADKMYFEAEIKARVFRWFPPMEFEALILQSTNILSIRNIVYF